MSRTSTDDVIGNVYTLKDKKIALWADSSGPNNSVGLRIGTNYLERNDIQSISPEEELDLI